MFLPANEAFAFAIGGNPFQGSTGLVSVSVDAVPEPWGGDCILHLVLDVQAKNRVVGIGSGAAVSLCSLRKAPLGDWYPPKS
jgi:hypothetical protein